MLERFDTIKWWLLHRFHPRHRYNVVRTGLTPGYYDVDILIQTSIITLLKQHFEGGDLEGKFDPTVYKNELRQNDYSRLHEIYLQFKDKLPNNYFDDLNYEEITSLLVEIVKLRGFLWS